MKSVALIAGEGEAQQFVLVLVRGDHEVNEIKLAKVAGLDEQRFASEAEIAEYLGSVPGFLGPVAPAKAIRVVADREVAAMSDFVVGANEAGFHRPASTGAATCRNRKWPTSATCVPAIVPWTAAN